MYYVKKLQKNHRKSKKLKLVMERRIETQLLKLEVVAKSLLEVIELIRSDLPTQTPYKKVQSEVRKKERPDLTEEERVHATGKDGSILTEKERLDATGKERYDPREKEKPESTDLRRSERGRSELIRLKIEDLKRQSSPSNPLCFRCGKSGHLAYRCLNRILCYVCGEHGHRAYECDQNVHSKLEINQNQLEREQKIRETESKDHKKEDLPHIEKQKVEVTSGNKILSAVILKQAQMLVSDVAGWGSDRIEEAFQQLVPNLNWKTRKIDDNTYLVDAVGSLEDQKVTSRGGEKLNVEACCIRCGQDRLCKQESSGKVKSVANEGENYLMMKEKEDGKSSGKKRVEVAVKDRGDSGKQMSSNGNQPIHIDGLVQCTEANKGDKEGRNTVFSDPVVSI